MPTEGHDHDKRGRPAGRTAGPPTAEHQDAPAAGHGGTGGLLTAAFAPALTGLLALGSVLQAQRPALLGVVCPLVLVAVVNAVLTVRAVRAAREPVPATPEPGYAVAFLATYAPGREPLSAVRAVLEGAVRLRHPGPLDVWLLDEGDDPEARMLCAELGVHHFTRRGVPEWNRARGPHEAGAEHGNHNAWIAKHGDDYGLLACAAPGHVPHPGFLERTTGWFRDADTAFVVGPQGEGADGPGPDPVHRALVQCAGNHHGAPLLSGSGVVVRVEALRGAGGFRAPATGDIAAGLEMHRRHNPLTGRHWRSVHSADEPAAREVSGARRDPSPGLRRTLLPLYGKALFRVPAGRLLGYTLLLLHRPVTVVGWALCALTWLLFPATAWAALTLPAALAPTAVSSLARLRERRRQEARGREALPLTEAERAPAAAAGTPAPGG
ncbi:glycosyl transferase [Streptomyces sp. NPDC001822]|uniref:glycosyl transferase n=1 Tax=Streptomyces sp. NPDC001822 TaxID=3364614 RepID=UPI003698375F